MLVLADSDLRHGGKFFSAFFFSSAKVRSFEMLRPKAIGLALDLRASALRPNGLTELTRCVIWRVIRELLVKFFSSFSEVIDVVKLPIDFERIEHGKRLLRSVIVPVFMIGFSSLLPREPVWICEMIFSVLLSFDE